MPTITLTSGASFAVEAGSSILAASEVAGLTLPYSCRTGRCSTCKGRVHSGQTRALQAETGLTAQEQSEGWILTCVHTAHEDVLLEAEDLGISKLPQARTLPCRIKHLEHLASDVLQVMLRLPPTAAFEFIPGQYVEIIGKDGLRRSYSLANASAATQELELHIRAVDGGAMSAYWFDEAKPNDLLRLHGPLGTFCLRGDSGGLDVVFLATGTGIAPVKAMLEGLKNAPPEAPPRSVTVIWGGRTRSDLYLDLARLGGPFHYIPVLSRGDADWTGRRGYVQQALLASDLDLANMAVYACGSDTMIHSAKAELCNAGLPARRFHSDAFVCSAKP